MKRQDRRRRSDPRAVSQPICRATIRDGRVTLNRWTPRLFGPGPEPAGFRTVTAALADLRVAGDDLIVTPVAHAPWGADAEEALLTWAPLAGYRRAWLPDRVVTFDALPPLGRASVECPGCAARWEDASSAFWDRVLADGWFPGRCPACGGSLPEWSVITAAHGASCQRPTRTNRC
jgi:hypothetical protein